MLCINQINVDNISHDITQSRYLNEKSNSLEKAEVIFWGSGALTELSRFLGEDVTKRTYNIKDLMYNIPCIHRAFSITYSGVPELFIPICNISFIREDTTSDAWIQFAVDNRYANSAALRYLPKQYKHTAFNNTEEYFIRKENSRFKWNIHSPMAERLEALSNYHKKIRKDLHYIYGESRMWYIKKTSHQIRIFLNVIL